MWQELRHTNLAELARQAPHLLPASGSGGGSDDDTAAGSDRDAAEKTGTAAASTAEDSSKQQQVSAKGSSKSGGATSGQQASVDAMQLSPQQRDAFVQASVCSRNVTHQLWIKLFVATICRATWF